MSTSRHLGEFYPHCATNVALSISDKNAIAQRARMLVRMQRRVTHMYNRLKGTHEMSDVYVRRLFTFVFPIIPTIVDIKLIMLNCVLR